VTHPFTTRQLPFFLTAPTPCPYLPGRQERKVFTKIEPGDGAALNDALTHAGFRRSQSILYRPACEACSACRSARVPVKDFDWNRGWRRILKRNARLTREAVPAEANPEHYGLLSAYLKSRHGDGDMAGMDFYEYAGMIEDGAQRTDVIEYRDPDGHLIAAALVDEVADGYSMVYSFFEPTLSRDSLGAFIILDHIRQAQERGLPFVYLGYWVKGSPKMDYKRRFRPLEVLDPAGWRRLEDHG
jgi:arginyl-tRNA--protein-N-Asp/Glu arginylyltransferase